MPQLLRCIKPIGRLSLGGIYTQVDQYACDCGRNDTVLVSVQEVEGLYGGQCIFCEKDVPAIQRGWFGRVRFVPFGDPNFKGADEDISIYQKKDQKIPSHPEGEKTPIRANKELVK